MSYFEFVEEEEELDEFLETEVSGVLGEGDEGEDEGVFLFDLV